MKPFKKIFFIAAFYLIPFLSFGQLELGYQFGPGVSFLSSQKLKSDPGLGFFLGIKMSSKIGHRMDYYAGYYVEYSTFDIQGYSISDTTTTKTKTTFAKYGMMGSIGVDYFIVPNALSIGAGAMVGYYGLIGDQSAYLGPPPSNPTFPTYTGGSVVPVAFDYGAHLSLIWKMAPNWRLSLDYYKGYAPLIADATMNDLVLTAHWILVNYAVSKPYQNKLTK